MYWKSLIIPLVVGILAGEGLGIITHHYFAAHEPISVKLELNAFDFLTTVATIWVGFHIKLVLDRGSELKNNVSSIILNKLDHIQKEIGSYRRTLADSSRLLFLPANSFQKDFNLHQSVLRDGLITLTSKSKSSIIDVDNFLAIYEMTVNDIHTEMTSMPPTANPADNQIKIVDGGYTYESSKSQIIQQTLNKLDRQIDSLRLSIAKL